MAETLKMITLTTLWKVFVTGKEREREGQERNGKERQGKERKGREGKGREGKGKERTGKEREGKVRRGTERKGQDRKETERKGTDRKKKGGGKVGKGREMLKNNQIFWAWHFVMHFGRRCLLAYAWRSFGGSCQILSGWWLVLGLAFRV